MNILENKWFEKAFFSVSGLLFILLVMGFVFVGGFILLLLLEG